MVRLKQKAAVDMIMDDDSDDDSASVNSSVFLDETDGDATKPKAKKRSSEELSDLDYENDQTTKKQKTKLPSTTKCEKNLKVTIRRCSKEGYKANLTPEKKPSRVPSRSSRPSVNSPPRNNIHVLDVKNSPSISRLTGTPYRRRTIHVDVKTPEASRRSSDKTPESLEHGRRRLSINLEKEFVLKSLCEKEKSEEKSEELPKRFSGIFKDSPGKSSPMRSGRTSRTPVRFIEESPPSLKDSSKKSSKNASHKPSPKCDLFKVAAPATPSSNRSTPKRSAAKKVKTYTDMSFDEESPVASPKKSVGRPKKKIIRFVIEKLYNIKK